MLHHKKHTSCDVNKEALVPIKMVTAQHNKKTSYLVNPTICFIHDLKINLIAFCETLLVGGKFWFNWTQFSLSWQYFWVVAMSKKRVLNMLKTLFKTSYVFFLKSLAQYSKFYLLEKLGNWRFDWKNFRLVWRL